MFTTSGRTITFPGFLRAYVEDTDEAAEKDDAEKRLPHLERGQPLDPRALRGRTATRRRRPRATPRRRWSRRWRSSASAARPPTPRSCRRSRTAATSGRRARRSSRPGRRSRSSGCWSPHFGRLVDYGFTASVENDLDAIANGERSRIEWLRRFYFGVERRERRSGPDLGAGRAEAADRRPARGDRRSRRQLDPAGRDRRGGAGRAATARTCSGVMDERASLPEDLAPDELTPEKVEELLAAPSGDRVAGHDRGRPGDHRQVRPVRPVRHRRGEDRVAVQVDVPRHGHARRRRSGC